MKTSFAIVLSALTIALAAPPAAAQVRVLDLTPKSYTPGNRSFVRPLHRFNPDGSYYNSLSVDRSVKPQKGRLQSRRFPSRQSTYRDTASTPSYRHTGPTYSFESPTYRVSTPNSRAYNNGASMRYSR